MARLQHTSVGQVPGFYIITLIRVILGIIQVSIIGVMKGDARSLDYS